jgi:hypothetical protein
MTTKLHTTDNCCKLAELIPQFYSIDLLCEGDSKSKSSIGIFPLYDWEHC